VEFRIILTWRFPCSTSRLLNEQIQFSRVLNFGTLSYWRKFDARENMFSSIHYNKSSELIQVNGEKRFLDSRSFNLLIYRTYRHDFSSSRRQTGSNRFGQVWTCPPFSSFHGYVSCVSITVNRHIVIYWLYFSYINSNICNVDNTWNFISLIPVSRSRPISNRA